MGGSRAGELKKSRLLSIFTITLLLVVLGLTVANLVISASKNHAVPSLEDSSDDESLPSGPSTATELDAAAADEDLLFDPPPPPTPAPGTLLHRRRPG